MLLAFGIQSYAQQVQKIKEKITANQKEKKEIDLILLGLNKEIINLNKLNKTDSTKVIVYDFKTKKYEKANAIPIVGEPLVFKIKNINRLAYNINIKSNDVAIADVYFNTEIKKALEKEEGQSPAKTELPKPLTISKQVITKEIFKDNIKIDPKDITLSNKYQETTEALNKLNSDNEKERTESLDPNEKINNKENTGVSQPELEKKKETNTNGTTNTTNEPNKDKGDIKNLTGKLSDLQDAIYKKDSPQLNAMVLIYNTFNTLNINYHDLYKESQSLNEIEQKYLAFRLFALNPLLSCEEYITDKEHPFLTEISKYETMINRFELDIIKFYISYNSAMNDWGLFDKLKNESRDYIRNRYDLIKNAVDEINRTNDTKSLSNKLQRAKAIDRVLKKKEAYEMSSSPIQPLEDYVTFEVEIKNRDDQSQYEYNDERKFVYMEYTHGGVRFDFSTGVVFDFGNRTSTYELTNSIVAGQKQIIATSKNDFTPTLAGMFHTSFRKHGILAFGLTLGASLNVETFQLNSLFPGFSLLLGKKQKFIVTVGPAFKLVETLKDNYKTNTDYAEANFTSNSALTSQQFRIGCFFGLTYNLTNEQKGTFKISDK